MCTHLFTLFYKYVPAVQIIEQGLQEPPRPKLNVKMSGYMHVLLYKMKSTEVQTSPIISKLRPHVTPISEPRAILGSKYAMATPAQFVKLSEW